MEIPLEFKNLTLDMAETRQSSGIFTKLQFEQYCCYWRNIAPRFSDLQDKHRGHNPMDCPIVKSLQENK